MKRICYILFIFLLLSAVSCANQPVEYVIYYDSTMGAPQKAQESISKETEILFENMSSKDFSYSSKTKVENPDAKATRTISITGKQYELNHLRSYDTSLSTGANSKLHPYGQFEHYRLEQDGDAVEAVFRRGTDKLVSFSNKGERHNSGAVSKESAEQLAYATLIEVYGEKTAKKYSLHTVVEPTNSSLSAYTFVYAKYICGYPTTDDISITYNTAGKLVSINATTYGIFDSVEDSISEKKITNAKEALLNTISDSYTIQSIYLALDSDGQCYLQVSTTRTVNGELRGEMLYINID